MPSNRNFGRVVRVTDLLLPARATGRPVRGMVRVLHAPFARDTQALRGSPRPCCRRRGAEAGRSVTEEGKRISAARVPALTAGRADRRILSVRSTSRRRRRGRPYLAEAPVFWFKLLLPARFSSGHGRRPTRSASILKIDADCVGRRPCPEKTEPAGGEAEPELLRGLGEVRTPLLRLLEVDLTERMRRSERQRPAVAPERAPLPEMRFSLLRYRPACPQRLGLRQHGRAMPRGLRVPCKRRMQDAHRMPRTLGRPVARAGGEQIGDPAARPKFRLLGMPIRSPPGAPVLFRCLPDRLDRSFDAPRQHDGDERHRAGHRLHGTALIAGRDQVHLLEGE